MSFKAWKIAPLGLAGALMATAALAAPTARQTELAHRYIAATHMERTMDATMKAMTPGMLANMPKGTAAEEARKAAVMEAMPEVMSDMMHKMVARLEPVVAEIFSEQELTDLVAFYESPTGRSLIAKSPELAARMAPIMRDLVPEMQAELKAKVCAKVDCSTSTPSSAAKPS